MTFRSLAQAGVAAALIAAGVATAQTAPPVTDTGPPPAEERNSTGAVVLENSPVRALRDQAAAGSVKRSKVGASSRAVLRATKRAQTRKELAGARAAEATDLYQRGAGSLTPR